MFEQGRGTIDVIDRDRGLAVAMIAADSEGYQEYRLTGPGLSVRFGTERNLQTVPPSWRTRMVSRDQASMSDKELLPHIESIVSHMVGRLLKTDPSNFIVSF